jgi:chromosome segregation ATPase
MKISKHIALGLALSLGLVGCGQSSQKDHNEPAAQTENAPSDLVSALSGVSAADKAALESTAEKSRAAILGIKAEIAAIEKDIKDNPSLAAGQQSKLDQLNDELSGLKEDYSQTQAALSDAEGYEMLLRFVIEHRVTAFEQLPQAFQDARNQIQQQSKEIQGQESSFVSRMDAALQKIAEAKSSLKSTERVLQEKMSSLQQKTTLSADEQSQLTSIQSYLETAKKLSTEQKNLAQARVNLSEHETALARAEKQKTDLTTNRARLVRQLMGIAANDSQGREDILRRIEEIQDKIVDADLLVYEHQSAVTEAKGRISTSQQSVEGLQSSMGTVVPGLHSLVNVDLDSQMKAVSSADQDFQTIQTDFQKWRQDVNQYQIDEAKIGRLEAFFAQKFPEASAGQATQPTVGGKEGDQPGPANGGEEEGKGDQPAKGDKPNQGDQPTQPTVDQPAQPTADQPTQPSDQPKQPSDQPTVDQPAQTTGDQPAKPNEGQPSKGDSPSQDQPTADQPTQPAGDQPTGDQPSKGDTPTESKPTGDQPSGDQPTQPTGDQPSGDQPTQPTGDQPSQPTGNQPTGDQPDEGNKPDTPDQTAAVS